MANIRINIQANAGGGDSNKALDELARKIDASMQQAANSMANSFNAATDRMTQRIDGMFTKATASMTAYFTTFANNFVRIEQIVDRIATKMGRLGMMNGPGAAATQNANPNILSMLSGATATGAYVQNINKGGIQTRLGFQLPGGESAWVNDSFSAATIRQGPTELVKQRQAEADARNAMQAQAQLAQVMAVGDLNRFRNGQDAMAYGNAVRAKQQTQFNGLSKFNQMVDQYGLTSTGFRTTRNAAGEEVTNQMFGGTSRTLWQRLTGKQTDYSATLNTSTGGFSFKESVSDTHSLWKNLMNIKDTMVAVAASIFSFQSIGGMLKRYLYDPFAEFVSKIFTATDEFRRFENSISGVAGGAGRARAIDTELLRASRTSPMTIKQLHEAGVGLTFTQYGASRVSGGSAESAARSMVEYATMLQQLSNLAPEQGVGGAQIAVREALAGNFQSARRRLNTSPELIAGSLQRPGGGTYSLSEITGNQTLTMEAFKSFADTWIGQAPIEGQKKLFSNASEKLRDSITQTAAGVGNAGVYDQIVARFRGMADKIYEFIDPDKNPKFKEFATKLSSTMTRVFDALVDSVLSFGQRLTGTNNISDMMNKLADGFTTVADWMSRALAYLPQFTQWIGAIFHAIGQGVVELYSMARSMMDDKYGVKGGAKAAGSWFTSGGKTTTDESDPLFAAKQQAIFETKQKFPGSANIYGTYEAVPLQGSWWASNSYGKQIPGDMAIKNKDAKAFYNQRLQELAASGQFRSEFNWEMPKIPDFQGIGSLASPYEKKNFMDNMIQNSITGGNIRPKIMGMLNNIGDAGKLFQAMGGTGSDFEFPQNPFQRALNSAKSLPGSIAETLKTQIGNDKETYQSYQQLLDEVIGDRSRLQKTAEATVGLRQWAKSGVPIFSGIGQNFVANAPDSATTDKMFLEQLKELSGRIKAVQETPQNIGIAAGGLAGALTAQIGQLPPGIQAKVFDQITNNLMGVIDEMIGPKSKLNMSPENQKKVYDAYHKAIAEHPDFFNKKSQEISLAEVTAAGTYGSYDAKTDRYTAPTTPREMLRRKADVYYASATRNATDADTELRTHGDTDLYRTLADQAAQAKNSGDRAMHELNTALKAIEDFSDRARSAIEGGIGDALYGLITQTSSVSDAFKSMANSILKSFSDMAANMLVYGLVGDLGKKDAGPGGMGPGILGGLFGPNGIASLFGSNAKADGGIFPGSFVPFHAFSGGGIAHSPTMGLVAEAGRPEAIVPLPNGRSIPVEMRGGGGGRTFIVQNEAQARKMGYNPSTDDLVNMIADDIHRGGRAYKAIKAKMR